MNGFRVWAYVCRKHRHTGAIGRANAEGSGTVQFELIKQLSLMTYSLVHTLKPDAAVAFRPGY